MRIGVCSDIHSQATRLRRIVGDMEKAGVDERWCLGDLIGGGPDPAEAVGLLREFDLCLLGNHDAWMLSGHAWPTEAARLRACDRVWMTSLSPSGGRHGVPVWHGSPSQPLLGFFTGADALRDLFRLRRRTLALVGHTHVPIAYVRSGPEVFEITAEPEKTIWLDPVWTVVANPGAVCGDQFDDAPWWLELDIDERSLRWHRGSP